ncbi:hypothetical protein GN958_ATG21250, partial [Phytophthora infestans]
TKSADRLRGVVLSIDSSKRQSWYDVQWDAGRVEMVAARSIQALRPCNAPTQPHQALEGPITSLLLGSVGDEEDTSEVAAPGISDDGKVLAYNRSWEFCSNVLIDSAVLLRKRTTSVGHQPFNQSMIKHTNAKLAARRQRTIPEGELFRFLLVRLAMAVEPRRAALRTYWEKYIPEGFVGASPNFGERFGVSRHTFEVHCRLQMT